VGGRRLPKSTRLDRCHCLSRGEGAVPLLQTIRLKSISRSRSPRSYSTFRTLRLPSASWTRGSSPCWVSRSSMSDDRFRYSAACWRVSNLDPGGAQDGESCVHAAGRAGFTRACVCWGSRLSPGLSPPGFGRGRPGVWILVPVDEELPTHEADADFFGGRGGSAPEKRTHRLKECRGLTSHPAPRTGRPALPSAWLEAADPPSGAHGCSSPYDAYLPAIALPLRDP
jgi:hypothetical protein